MHQANANRLRAAWHRTLCHADISSSTSCICIVPLRTTCCSGSKRNLPRRLWRLKRQQSVAQPRRRTKATIAPIMAPVAPPSEVILAEELIWGELSNVLVRGGGGDDGGNGGGRRCVQQQSRSAGRASQSRRLEQLHIGCGAREKQVGAGAVVARQQHPMTSHCS